MMRLAESCRLLVVLVGDDLVEVAGDGAHVAVDGPLVVVEHHDQPLGLLGDVVQRLEGNSIGEGGVAGHGDHVLLAAGQIARHGHAQRRRQRRAGVSRAVAVVLALGAQHEAVQPARLANRLHALQPPGEHLVDVGLVADVEEQLVLGSIEDRVQRQGQLHHSQIRPQVAAGLRERLNQELANLLGQLRPSAQSSGASDRRASEWIPAVFPWSSFPGKRPGSQAIAVPQLLYSETTALKWHFP